MREIELFHNEILEPNDNRPFKEYDEESITYEFIDSVVGLIDNYDPNKKYFQNGSFDTDGRLAVFLYGYENNLDIDEVNNHVVSSEVKRHNGVQLINVRSDKRMFECGETNNVWVKSFPELIETWNSGSFADANGHAIKDRHNCTKTCYTYDYVWLVVNSNYPMPFPIIEQSWHKIAKGNYTYYIQWINQKER